MPEHNRNYSNDLICCRQAFFFSIQLCACSMYTSQLLLVILFFDVSKNINGQSKKVSAAVFFLFITIGIFSPFQILVLAKNCHENPNKLFDKEN